MADRWNYRRITPEEECNGTGRVAVPVEVGK